MGQQCLGLVALQERGLGSCECHVAFIQMGYKLILLPERYVELQEYMFKQKEELNFLLLMKSSYSLFLLLCVHYPNGVSMIISVVLKKISLSGLLLARRPLPSS